MGGDYSRKSFSPLRDFASVLLQQGHPTLDADWNEFGAILERRLRAGTIDTIGRAVVPRETPNGFEIRVAAGPALTIGRGRMYVAGLLAENHGLIDAGNPAAFDRSRLIDGRPVGILDELISDEAGDFVDYLAQPYWPNPTPLPQGGGPHLVYLDVWQREVTPLKDPRLLEPALGGIDTATRLQTVWQVRVLEDAGEGTTCGSEVDAFDALAAPSAAHLTTATIEYEDPDEPCLIPPGGGYRGLENQLYRVEIHSGATLAGARFKWSRDNGSVGATVESFAADDRLIVRRIGRDQILRFRTGDWVEVTDDRREFAGLSGDMRRVEVAEDTNELSLSAPLSADLVPSGIGDDTAAARHSRVIRWDQNGAVLLANGDPWADLDEAASDGLIPVPTDGSAVVLEAGITVTFSSAPAGGPVRPQDHWCFAARTADASIEILTEAPPAGIHHHLARLAIVTFPETVADCRIFWPPEFGGECCACTVCVSAEEHNSGTQTIQAAIAALPPEGGTVCLGPGGYLLGTTPVEIAGRSSVRLVGHGPGTLLAYTGNGGAVRITNAVATRLEDFAVLVAGDRGEGGTGAAAFHVRTAQETELTRLAGLVLGGAQSSTRGLALDGAILRLGMTDTLLFSADAIGGPERSRDEEGPGYLLAFDVAIDDNTLIGLRRGVALEGAVLHLGPTRLTGNVIAAGDAGIAMRGLGAFTRYPDDEDERSLDGLPLANVRIEANTIFGGPLADGIISGLNNQRILDNEIRLDDREGRDRPTTCIRLVEGILPGTRADSMIIGNRIGRAGFGITVEALQGTLLIKQNSIEACSEGGIIGADRARIETLAIDNNVIDRIGGGRLAEPLAAIRLAGIIDARILGNAIRRVGLAAANQPYVAGIDLRGALLLQISGNSLSEIGPRDSGNPGIGIRLRWPLFDTDISGNRILGLTERENEMPGDFAGIVIEHSPQGGAEEPGLAAGDPFPAFVALDTGIMMLSRQSLAAFARPRETALKIDGNLISDAHRRSALPLVLVLGQQDRSGSTCGFSSNQVQLFASGIAPATVILQAQRVIAGNNLVRRDSDADAIQIMLGAFGQPSVTAVGNITFGNIRVNGGNLPAPFQPLNILG